ncbi:MAG: ABC transporter permease [Gammaproteobacteria bacterium]|nr:MAG: ABC transporter permease [Gammaproteobacteria bacterium]
MPKSNIQAIPFQYLVLAAIPVIITLSVFFRWSCNYFNGIYAVSRMLVQLLIIGYFLTYIFQSDCAFIVLGVVAFMLLVSAWISLRTVPHKRKSVYFKALLALFIGGASTLALMSLAILQLQPWYMPKYFIPLAGMVFANSMNSISLAADRINAELGRGESYCSARNTAFKAALIPTTNSLFAVGLVSIPGMMTGQILSGIPPLIAVRYQIMIMCMIFGTSGITTALFLSFSKNNFGGEQSLCNKGQ